MTHPGVADITDLLVGSGAVRGPIGGRRAVMAAGVAVAPPPVGVTVRVTTVGGVPAELVDPEGVASDAAVLYLHGGGYCTGTPGTHRGIAARLAVAVGTPVVTLDYRLGPEHHFPAALDDACAAVADLLAGDRSPGRLVLAGDSAGGGLAVATLLARRDAGLPLPAGAACFSPWCDLTQTSAAMTERAERDPILSRAALDEMAAAYLGDADPRTPHASPLLAEDLGGLPPVTVHVGSEEVLVDDAVHLVERLRAAGGRAEVTVWSGLVHVFQLFPGPLVPEADESVSAVAAFLADCLAAGA